MYTSVCVQSLSSIEPVVVKIFEVVKRWVMVDVWGGVSILPYAVVEFSCLWVIAAAIKIILKMETIAAAIKTILKMEIIAAAAI